MVLDTPRVNGFITRLRILLMVLVVLPRTSRSGPGALDIEVQSGPPILRHTDFCSDSTSFVKPMKPSEMGVLLKC
jgi:hypothetical protein